MTKKEKALRFLNHQPVDFVPDPMELQFMGDSELIKTLDIPVRERPLRGTGYDVFGVHWTDNPAASHRTPGQKPAYEDIEEWREQLRFPNIEKFEWDQLRQEAAQVDREKYIVNVVMYNGPFERTTMLTSFEDCLVNLISDPEDFADLVGAIADYKIALIEKIWECAQPDTFLFHDDWGTMKSTFMSPDLWRQVIKPHIQRIYDAIHAHGALVIQHSCGAITPLVGDMVEMGADGWDGQGDCNDLDALEKQYGHRLYIAKKPEGFGPPPAGDDGPPPFGPDGPMMPNQKYGAYDEYPEFLFS